MEALESELKQLIVEVLSLKDVKPQEIDSQAPLLVEGLGLDSIDALELAMAVGKKYSVKFSSEESQNREAFASVRSLAQYVAKNRPRAEVQDQVVSMMSEMFELSPEQLKPEAKLFEELDLDSIDAIDMVVKLQEMTGRRVNDAALKKVRTVKDVIDLVEEHYKAAEA
jgi:acyl carrier protein